MARKCVGILIFPDVEVLDFCGPFEVFSVTRLNEERRREESSPFEVLLVGETAEPARTTGGMRVIPDVTIDACPRLDVLVVPGGWGTRTVIKNERVLQWIADRGRAVETLTRSARGRCCSARRACSTGAAPRRTGVRCHGCASRSRR